MIAPLSVFSGAIKAQGQEDRSVGQTVKNLPNIIILLPDQLRAHSLGCMGNSDVITPNIDRLASEGILLRNTFSNTPVSCPARAILLTGKYAHQNGMVANDLRLRESETTLAEILASAGYTTGYIGKWHLDGGWRYPGFIPPGDRRQGFEYWAANECSHNHFNNTYFRDEPTPLPLGKYETEAWTDIAIQYLKTHSSGTRPFFLMVSYGPPHDPYKAPPNYEILYDSASLTMRPNWVSGLQNGSRKDIASYYASITAIDDQVGRLMYALEELDLDKNTILIFISDHGDQLGSQGAFFKRQPWEESVHVPGIVKYPEKIKPGQETDALISLVDFAPTILGLCGLKPGKDMQGSDLSDFIVGKSRKTPASSFFQIFGPAEAPAGWRGIRTKQYMYARFADKPWVLYDMTVDPYQMNNLVDDPASEKMLSMLDKMLLKKMRQTGDSWSNDWTSLVESGQFDEMDLFLYDDTFYSISDYLKWKEENPDAKPKFKIKK